MFNLPFSVRIAGADPVDGDRYLAADLAARESLITNARAYEGLTVYQQDTKTVYLLETLVEGNPGASTWVTLDGGVTQLGATNGLAIIGSDIGLGGTMSEPTTISVQSDLNFVTSDAGAINFNIDETSGITVNIGNSGGVTYVGGNYTSHKGVTQLADTWLDGNNQSSYLRNEASQSSDVEVGGLSKTYVYQDAYNITNELTDVVNNTTSGIDITPTGITLKNEHFGYGALYAADYSANYINRSLVDKEYVDSLIVAPLTDAEIKIQYENNANTNEFSDGEKTKLAGLDSSRFLGEYVDLAALQTAHPSPIDGSYANVDAGIGEDVERWIWDTSDDQYVQQLGTSTILTDAQIKVQYENNVNTNAFTDTEQTKLSNAITNGINGLTKVGSDIKLGGTLTESTTIDGDGNNLQIDNTDTLVITDMNSNQLVMANGTIQATMSNGNSFVMDDSGINIGDGVFGSTISLDNTGVTITDGANGNSISQTNSGININDGVNGGGIFSNSNGISIAANVNGNGVYLTSDGISIVDAVNSIDILTNNEGFKISDNVNNVLIKTSTGGFELDADYSANYTDRSLVDKEYVDNATSLQGIVDDAIVDVGEVSYSPILVGGATGHPGSLLIQTDTANATNISTLQFGTNTTPGGTSAFYSGFETENDYGLDRKSSITNNFKSVGMELDLGNNGTFGMSIRPETAVTDLLSGKTDMISGFYGSTNIEASTTVLSSGQGSGLGSITDKVNAFGATGFNTLSADGVQGAIFTIGVDKINILNDLDNITPTGTSQVLVREADGNVGYVDASDIASQSVNSYSETVTTWVAGPNNTYTQNVQHDLGTLDLVYSFRDTNTNEIVYVDIFPLNTNLVRLTVGVDGLSIRSTFIK